MNTVYIDTRRLNTMEKIHCYLQDVLEFPSYYGGNLDALCDAITDIFDETTIHVARCIGCGALNEKHLEKLIYVLRDCSKHNPHIHIKTWDIIYGQPKPSA